MALASNRSRAVLQAKLLRRALRRSAARLRYRRLSLAGLPILFANSFPKSGTHLLTQVLSGFTRLGPAVDSGLPAVVTYAGDSGRPFSPEQILGSLQRLLPGDIGYGHIHAIPRAVDFLCQDGFATYFILRDPRDVVVSHVHYVSEMAPTHILHRTYTERLAGFDERLTASIRGLPDIDISFPDIQARFAPYLDWLDQPQVRCLHYEDFVRDRPEAVGKVLDHAVRRGFPLSVSGDRAIAILCEAIDPQRSPTFHRGKIGAWSAHFRPEHKRLFKEVAGDLLIRLGYETGYDW